MFDELVARTVFAMCGATIRSCAIAAAIAHRASLRNRVGRNQHRGQTFLLLMLFTPPSFCMFLLFRHQANVSRAQAIHFILPALFNLLNCELLAKNASYTPAGLGMGVLTRRPHNTLSAIDGNHLLIAQLWCKLSRTLFGLCYQLYDSVRLACQQKKATQKLVFLPANALLSG